MSYDRILSIENLSDVPNPWKGFTVNRCLVLALVVLLVTSGVNELHGEYCNHTYREKTQLTKEMS